MDKSLVARIFRGTARIILAANAIICVGTIILLVSPTISTSHSATITQAAPTTSSAITQAATGNSIAQSIVIIFSVAIALVLIAKIISNCNQTIRLFIRRIAKCCKISIFSAELLLACFFGGLCTALLSITLPTFSIIALFSFILDEFCFVFAWLSYGQPTYVY